GIAQALYRTTGDDLPLHSCPTPSRMCARFSARGVPLGSHELFRNLLPSRLIPSPLRPHLPTTLQRSAPSHRGLAIGAIPRSLQQIPIPRNIAFRSLGRIP